MSEGWNWLRAQGLIVPASGRNGANDFMAISRAGEAINGEDEFERYRSVAAFPKEMLHPSIADKV